MTAAQLDAAIALTGHERYRWLTSDANPDATQREGYRRVVESIADREIAAPEPPSEPEPPPVPLSASLRAAKLGGRNCPHGSAPACGCSDFAACSLLGRDVSIRDCSECLTTGPRSREVT